MIDSPAARPLGPSGISAAFGKSIGGHWKLFLAEGAILVVLGILAVLAPFLAGVAATIFIGWLFLFAGVSGLIFSYQSRTAPGFWWALLSSAVALLAGIALLWSPLAGLFTLTVVLIAYFIVDGVLTILLGLEHRRELTDRWQWIVVNGVIDLVLAAILISGLPGSVLWALGLLVGIDLIFGGASIISLALAARKAAA
ncbi:conserved membrane hypothetical protein [Methylocella tundrae]|uniref:HdeD family acid-resistance protein n=1 Tax=Methylocella tundrae TaxID=227605 RepID=A0A8B6M2B7_METTU|nr:HdeD family acid-resistance protein [Methylocella tundrae]VTZ25137.1 conserved membrane hypothetical protein [Methylocella tundrae]VTZ48302.1 conserved membrane hypothetical protein [Methylocella tundrae]